MKYPILHGLNFFDNSAAVEAMFRGEPVEVWDSGWANFPEQYPPRSFIHEQKTFGVIELPGCCSNHWRITRPIDTLPLRTKELRGPGNFWWLHEDMPSGRVFTHGLTARWLATGGMYFDVLNDGIIVAAKPSGVRHLIIYNDPAIDIRQYFSPNECGPEFAGHIAQKPQ